MLRGGRGKPQPHPETVCGDKGKIRERHGGYRSFRSFEESGGVGLGVIAVCSLVFFACSLWLHTQSQIPEPGETLETDPAFARGLLGCAGGHAA